MFDPATKAWTWISGSNATGAVGVYGSQGLASASNTPGARSGAFGWIDSQNNLWLFGGNFFGDLWEFSPTKKVWTWIGGTNTISTPGNYGTLGTTAATSMPGGRSAAVVWTDPNGSFWLFGGYGDDSAGNPGDLNDLWRYQP